MLCVVLKQIIVESSFPVDILHYCDLFFVSCDVSFEYYFSSISMYQAYVNEGSIITYVIIVGLSSSRAIPHIVAVPSSYVLNPIFEVGVVKPKS